MGRELTLEEKNRLLELARRTIENLVQGRSQQEPKPALEGLLIKGGAFVTIHRQGQLRGCIGNFVSDNPLYQTVEEMAVSAAARDPRFPPVGERELEEIDVEISVLSPLEPVDDVKNIEVGVHGIYIISPRGRGVLLPQVATEQGWDRETFLQHTCMKAGLNSGCWEEPNTEVLVFTAQVFGEKDLNLT